MNTRGRNPDVRTVGCELKKLFASLELRQRAAFPLKKPKSHPSWQNSMSMTCGGMDQNHCFQLA